MRIELETRGMGTEVFGLLFLSYRLGLGTFNRPGLSLSIPSHPHLIPSRFLASPRWPL